MKPNPSVYGLLAEFTEPRELLSAAEAARDAGYQRIETYSPLPVEGLYETLGRRASRLPWAVAAAGLSGALLGYGMQYFMNAMDYPLNVGGRPLNSWPAFFIVTFEVAVLAAALMAVAGLLIGCRLPRLHHPVFSVPRFAAASQDRFFLCIRSEDERFDADRTRAFLQQRHPHALYEVPR